MSMVTTDTLALEKLGDIETMIKQRRQQRASIESPWSMVIYPHSLHPHITGA